MSTTPRTIAVPLHPNQPTASYSLASGLAQFVESVYIEVDGTAAGDMQPLLTLSEQSGVVIAKKRQGGTITGGTSGSATWALRLTDEKASGTSAGFIKYNFANTGGYLTIATTGRLPNPETIVFTVPVGQINFYVTDPTFGQFLVQAPFFHFFTTHSDFRLLDDGTGTWAGDTLQLTFPSGIEGDVNSGNILWGLNAAGDKFVVSDHNGATIFQLTG